MIRGALLRATVNRKLIVLGEEEKLSDDRSCVLIKDFDITGKSANGVLTLQSVATVRILDRVVFVRPNPRLYEEGTVQTCPMLSSMDEAKHIKVYFKPNNKDFDVKTLTHFVELYIGGE